MKYYLTFLLKILLISSTVAPASSGSIQARPMAREELIVFLETTLGEWITSCKHGFYCYHFSDVWEYNIYPGIRSDEYLDSGFILELPDGSSIFALVEDAYSSGEHFVLYCLDDEAVTRMSFALPVTIGGGNEVGITSTDTLPNIEWKAATETLRSSSSSGAGDLSKTASFAFQTGYGLENCGSYLSSFSIDAEQDGVMQSTHTFNTGK